MSWTACVKAVLSTVVGRTCRRQTSRDTGRNNVPRIIGDAISHSSNGRTIEGRRGGTRGRMQLGEWRLKKKVEC